MPIRLSDTLVMDGPRITQDGYLVADVRAARTGIQEYSGREVDPENAHGMRDKAIVRVYRDEAEVFSHDTLASFTSIPVTDDHPPASVTAENWRIYARGNTGEQVARDGETMRVPLIVKDASAIKKVQDGKRELSCGYECDLDWTPGTTKDGLAFDAKQVNIRGNHLAIVGRARGGPELRIGDGIMPKTLVIDGHSLEFSDAAAIVVENMQRKLADADTALADANKKVGELTAQVSTKDGEIAALKTKLGDAEMTPAKLDAAVAARGKVIADAKKIFPAIVTDGKTDTAIRKEAVTHKIADAATMDDNAIAGAFSALAATIQTTDALAAGVAVAKPSGDLVQQAAEARMKRDRALSDGWKTTAQAN